MGDFATIAEVLDYAIGQEQEAADFYTDLAGKVERKWMTDVFLGFAKEEAGHKKKLEAIKGGQLAAPVLGNILDLKIGDYLVTPDPENKIDYQGALILAMKKEKAAFRLYSDLAAHVDDENLKNAMLMLAQEEAKHKLRFEVEYDDFILTEN